MSDQMSDTTAPYTVQAAAALAGVNPATLRMWEQRYGLIQPSRTGSGHRRYDQPALERLKLVATLVRYGHPIGVVARLDGKQLQALLERARTARSETVSSATRARLDALCAAVQKFDLVTAGNLIRWLRTALGARAFVLEVAVPLFSHVGVLVAESRFDISQEHALSAILRDHLGDLLRTLQGLAPQNGSASPIVFACPEGDRHEFGILLASVLASVRGLAVFYAGSDLPAANLARAAEAVGARMVVLGNTSVPVVERRVGLEAFLLEIDERLAPFTEVLVGGNGERPRLTLPSGRAFGYVNSLEEFDALLERTE